ncbi:MAG TPA: glycoside hydrolase family 3 protein [Thermoanaerobaculia bacterium]|nr:glycoside hydrolase family 3 protein [Thermoanaerobaculia bacterium]
MSDDEKIGQLLFVGFSGVVDSSELRQLVSDRHVGGIVFYAKNIESPEQVKILADAIKRYGGRKAAPFIAIDQEGGIVRRFRLGVPVIPSAMAIGATRSPELARRAGAAVGSALRELGFTMNFAPVLDVLTVQSNSSIGTRAFGSDAKLVADLGAAFIEGQQSAGVIAVGKHFPGIGGVAEDTHKTLPRLDASLDELRRRELLPFRRAADIGLEAVMIGHIALPRLAEHADLPVTLSKRATTTLLRQELRFDGIAITDALQMDALARKRGAAALAIEALYAGSDMVLMLGGDAQRDEVLVALRAAYRHGRLPKARVHQALRRILRVKMTLAAKPFSAPGSDGVVEEIARRAVTRVGSIRQLQAIPDLHSRLLYVGPDGTIHRRLGTASVHLMPARPDRTDVSRVALIAASMKNASLCIAAAATQEQFEVIRDAHKRSPNTPLVFVNLGSPHRILQGERSVTLLTYADDDASQLAAVRVILGEAEASGVAPVVLP